VEADVTAVDQARPAPEVMEGPGRYVVLKVAEGEWVLARAVGICESCRSCGCGAQADNIPLPDFTAGRQALLSWAMKHMGDLRAVLGRGD
jgi:hypothetical protein